MNQAKINELKAISEATHAAHDAEKAGLTAAGFKSQERYTMLKDLKSAADKAHAEYSKFAKSQISHELDKIIAADRPTREAESRARSAWKMAKFNAAK